MKISRTTEFISPAPIDFKRKRAIESTALESSDHIPSFQDMLDKLLDFRENDLLVFL